MKDPWLDWIVELQSIAQAGLQYGRDRFDLERYARLREISAEMLASRTELPADRVRDLFCSETGYQTPKVDTRAAVFRGERILLVREASGAWSLPGGWLDVGLTVRENAVKEVLEEAGIEARAERIIAVQDRDRRNRPPLAWKIVKIFVECTPLGGQFRENSETTDSGWFSPGALPPLDENRTTRGQIELCFEARGHALWQPQFD